MMLQLQGDSGFILDRLVQAGRGHLGDAVGVETAGGVDTDVDPL